MSKIQTTFNVLIDTISDHKISALLFFGLLAILLAVLFPVRIDVQVLLGELGLVMLIGGVLIHLVSSER